MSALTKWDDADDDDGDDGDGDGLTVECLINTKSSSRRRTMRKARQLPNCSRY